MKKLKDQGPESWDVKLRASKTLFFILMVLGILGGCAKPHYVNGLEGKIDGISGECGLLFESEDICLQTDWINKPTESRYGEMILRFLDRNDQTRPVDPLTSPFILLWMPSMGHGSSPVKIERIDVGTFKATDIFFIMPGPWEIRYQLKDGSDVVEERIQKITI